MKKTFIVAIFALVSLFAFTGGTALAQKEQVTLPSPGLTPESSFYFLDRFGETLRQFFTLKPEAKARLQIEFAGERIAEIKLMVEEKGPGTKGIIIAQSLLLTNVAHAAEIVQEEKADGKDVTQFAKNLDDEFDAREKLLEQTFKEAKQKLQDQKREIKSKLLAEARKAGDTAQVALLEKQLQDIEAQKDALNQKKDALKKDLENEQKKLESELNADDQKQEQEEHDQDIEEQKAEVEVEEAMEAEESQDEAEAPEKLEMKESREQKGNGSEDHTQEVQEESEGRSGR